MLIVISGPMFAGKTTELIRYLECAVIAEQSVVVCKPSVDTRAEGVRTHSGLMKQAIVLPISYDHTVILPKVDVYGIDEAQFMEPSWLPAIDELANEREVICSCLNQDSTGRPFGITPQLLAMADHIIHVKAVCIQCKTKAAATKTFRTGGTADQINIGGADKYKAMCRSCWSKQQEDTR